MPIQPSSAAWQATAVGFSAILMWATLALLTKLSSPLPPFQLTAIAFSLAALIGLVLQRRSGLKRQRLPLAAWLHGVGGLFGFHFFYFLALQQAPAVEASLIVYLWPLLIVLLSARQLQEPLRWFQIVGAVAGFAGAALLVSGGQGFRLDWAFWPGYGAALVCALTWAVYSVRSRAFGSVPTHAVGGFCGATALLAWLCHLLLEVTVWPSGSQWAAIAALGLGPVGLAFYTWDYGVKYGNLKLLGALSYLAPLLSTLLLLGTGFAAASWSIAVACLLIVGGAGLAAYSPRQSPRRPPASAQRQ